MALPVGVTTATITFGVPVSFTGSFVRSTVSVVPSATLIHAATGTPLINFLEDVVLTEGTAGQFVLPHTDQTGFVDESGNSYQNWYYTATVTYSTNKGTLPVRTKVFQLPTGQTTVDLDLIPVGAPVLPFTAPTANVTSFHGRIGAVTVQDSDLPARLSDASLKSSVAEQVAEYSPTVAGALGNGVQDDTTYLQGLIDSAAAEYAAGASFTTRRTVVQLPRGQWAIGASLQLKTGVRLRGVGKASSIVALPALGATAMLLGTSGNTVTDAVIEDVALTGSYSTSPVARTGIQITNGARATVRRVHFSDLGGAGALFQGLNAGGGTPDSQVIDCTFDGIGLSDGTTGFGILFKDNSQRCIARGNVLKNIKGGMGIGGNGSAGTGYPLRATIVDNVISMVASTTGFEAIGWTAGCDYWMCSGNQIYDSFDNGISCSGAWANVSDNIIDGAWNHGIASAGNNNVIIGNSIRNVGKENPASAFGYISATSTTGNLIALNKGVDDQGSKTTTHGVKYITSGGTNNVFANTFTGHTGATITGSISTDQYVTFSADGIQTRRVSADLIIESTVGVGIAIGSTCGLNGLAFTGSGRLGTGQHVFSSNLAATRPATYAYAQFGQAADISQWGTTASDNTTQTVRAGVTATGRIYSTEGVRTKDLGAVDGLTSAQIDALFLATPTDGTMAVGTLSSAAVFLHRKGGKWNYSAATQIA